VPIAYETVRIKEAMGILYRAAVALVALMTLVPVVVRAQAIEIPAERRGEYFYVQTTINNQASLLVIDSGAGAHCLTPAAAQRLGLAKADGPKLKAVGTADSVEVTRLKTGEISLGKAKMAEGLAIAVPLPAALECDGVLGYDLFQQYVVTMDYGNKKVTLTPPKDFQPPANAVAVPLRVVNRLPQIEVRIDGISCWIEVDTGSNGSVDLNTPFVEQNKLRDKYSKRIAMPTGRGVGGVSYGEMTRGETFTLGTFTLPKPILQLSQQKTGMDSKDDVAGRIGTSVLARFAVTFDYSRGKMYLVKGKDYETPFIFNRSGFVVDEEYRITFLIPNGPAMEAGLQLGDELIAVDGKGITKLPAYQLWQRLRAAPGTAIRLTVRDKDGKVRETSLTLRDIL
jgi:hypothetical protein